MSDSLRWGEADECVRSGSPADLDRVVAFARTQFGKGYYSCKPDSIRALAGVALREPPRRTAVVELLREGLQIALSRGTKPTDANMLAVAACAVALGRLGAREAAPDLVAAYARCEAGHFELRQCDGPIALALTAMGEQESQLPMLRSSLAELERIWGHGQRFVHQVRYATWVLGGDSAAAMAWLESGHEAGNIHAAAALADLDAKALAPTLKITLEKRTGSRARRAVEEALRRLETQPGVPAADARMAWLLDVWHDNEPTREFPKLYASAFGT